MRVKSAFLTSLSADIFEQGLTNNVRIFRPLSGRHIANKRLRGPESRFLESARRALQDLLYTFFGKKTKFTQVILHYEIFLWNSISNVFRIAVESKFFSSSKIYLLSL